MQFYDILLSAKLAFIDFTDLEIHFREGNKVLTQILVPFSRGNDIHVSHVWYTIAGCLQFFSHLQNPFMRV